MLHHLVFCLVPAQLLLLLLTLSGCGNLSGSGLLVYSCDGALLLVGGVFAASLGLLPCAVLFLRGLQLAQLTLLQVPLGIFRSPGGDVGWASALPFVFCASPAPTGLRELAGFGTLCQGATVGMVSVLSSPCWLSLTLGWVSFWTAVSLVSVAA